jgi:hypothetical protein
MAAARHNYFLMFLVSAGVRNAPASKLVVFSIF